MESESSGLIGMGGTGSVPQEERAQLTNVSSGSNLLYGSQDLEEGPRTTEATRRGVDLVRIVQVPAATVERTVNEEERRNREERRPLATPTGENDENSPRPTRGARRTRALLRLLNVSDPAMLFYLALLVNVPQMSVVAVVFPLYWNAQQDHCDAALQRYWKVWGLVHALRLGATTVVAGLRWRFHREETGGQDETARRRAAVFVANARNSLDAVALIWFVFGNMWLLSGSDDACHRGEDRDDDASSRGDPTKSPIYLVDVCMLAIQYAQICLPCVFAIAMVPVFCFCLPCVIRLLAALHEPGQTNQRGASRRAIADLPTIVYDETDHLNDDQEEPSCPVCFTNFQRGDRLRVLPCKHSFHQACIDEWLNRNASCPLCRRSILNNDDNNQNQDNQHDSSSSSSEGGGNRRPPAGAIEMEPQLAEVTVV